jgi:hypothetical protein
MYAGITIMHYPPKRTEDVYQHIREVLVPHHAQLQSQGCKDALFLVNPESCQGIGIAIWDDAAKLREVEKGTSREMARAMRDPKQAPTEYARLRAQWVEDLGGGIVSTDWYEVVGHTSSASNASSPGAVLFPSLQRGKPAYAGITIMHYPPKRTEDVYKHIREVLLPHHAQLQSQGCTDGLFLVNPESCQGIGIAIWDDPGKLRDVEKGTSREMALAMRDPKQAPTEYARLRAQWVEDLGGGIVSTDWYEVVGRASAGSAPTPPSPRPGKPAPTWP